MESLFGCNSANSIPKEPIKKPKAVIPPVEQENRVLDPKKSQNIAILLRALNVTKEEVSEALLDGTDKIFHCFFKILKFFILRSPLIMCHRKS